MISLLLTLSLVGAEPSDEPPPPPDPGDDEEIVIEDEDEGDYEGDDEGDDEGDATTTEDEASEPVEPAPAPTPATIPTEGETKPPPSAEALERDDPLQQPDTRPRDRAGRPGSPQRFSLEFKMGPYLPDVDRTYSGAGLGPYASIFGETDSTGAAVDQPRAFPMPALGFDWQFLYLAGPLGVGVQLGFFRDTAQALLTTPMEDESLRSSADETRFAMLPMALLLSYRFELLADRFRFPLVPYAKGGLAYSLFWSRNDSGNLARNSRGESAVGGVPGWQLNLGGMFRLDIIEPGTAKKLDNLTGINHTYLFGEYQISRVNNFGVGQAISLGDNTWFAGLAIEF